MAGPDDIENRLTVLEQDVAELREKTTLAASDAAAARVLAAGADRDVSEVRAELRAHTQALNALRETQLEQGRMLTDQGRVLADQGRVLADQGRVLADQGRFMGEQSRTMAQGFATLHAGMTQISTVLERVAGPDAG